MICRVIQRKILGIETSCDDTSVAIVAGDGEVLSLETANRDFIHSFYGGVVPEIASRNHTAFLLPLIDRALQSESRIDAIAVTTRPGLVGSLMVGANTAETLGWVKGLPVVAINHLEGHIYSAFLKDTNYSPPFDQSAEFVALVVSGGHTSIILVSGVRQYKVLGATRDDAAGEAFDKVAKLLGLGFPGGPALDELSRGGDSAAFKFTRPMSEQTLEMSFSGLKSQAARWISDEMARGFSDQRKIDFASSFSLAIVDTLIHRLDQVRKVTGVRRFAVVGGVSANSLLRSELAKWAEQTSVQVAIPPLRYCTDNAAMIAMAGHQILNANISDSSLKTESHSRATDFS